MCFRTSGVISIPRANFLPIWEEAAAMLIGKTDDRPRPRLELGARRLLWRSPFVISQFHAPTLVPPYLQHCPKHFHVCERQWIIQLAI